MPPVAKKRGRRYGTRKAESSAMREHLKDTRLWVTLGIVSDEDGDGHFEVFEKDGEQDVFVEVTTVPNEDVLFARLACLVGGPGQGIWRIPAVGTEVLVLVPDGEVECSPIIMGMLSTGELPDGVDEATTLIIGGAVEIRSKGGTVDQLVTKGEFERHVHATAPTGAVSIPSPLPPGGPLQYTTVLKAE